jgi:hypothetical protein
MAMRMFNGLQIDVPDGWADVSTVVVAPIGATEEGNGRPSINMVVKRRPSANDDTDKTVLSYLRFMKNAFGTLQDVQTKEMMAGSIKGKAVKFNAASDGRKFTQVTFLFHAGGEEISATVTQVDGDGTPMAEIERLLRSVRPAAAGVRGLR